MTKSELIHALNKYPNNVDINLCIKGKEHDISIKPVIDMESNQLHICLLNETVEQGYWSKRTNKTDMN